MHFLRNICIRLYHSLQNRLFGSYTAWARRIEEIERESLKEKLKECGRGVRLRGSISISGPDKVSIGDNVHIGHNVIIMGVGGLLIGDNTHISNNLVIYTGNHNYKGERLPYDHTYIYKPVNIGKNVWIGVNVTIIPGVKIGDGAIVGAGTVVDRDVPPLAIIGSSPFRILKYRDADHYWNLENAKKYGGINGRALPEGIEIQ